jgi:hypothetical protein
MVIHLLGLYGYSVLPCSHFKEQSSNSDHVPPLATGPSSDREASARLGVTESSRPGRLGTGRESATRRAGPRENCDPAADRHPGESDSPGRRRVASGPRPGGHVRVSHGAAAAGRRGSSSPLARGYGAGRGPGPGPLSREGSACDSAPAARSHGGSPVDLERPQRAAGGPGPQHPLR